MKMKWIIRILPLILLLNSCSEQYEPKPLTYTQLLTGVSNKSWRATGIQIREDNVSVGNIELPATDCLFDDLYIFYANPEKTFVVDDRSIKCSESDPDIVVADRWSFVNATATLEIVIPFLAPFRLPFIVKKLNETDMELEIWLDQENKDSYRIYFRAINSE